MAKPSIINYINRTGNIKVTIPILISFRKEIDLYLKNEHTHVDCIPCAITEDVYNQKVLEIKSKLGQKISVRLRHIKEIRVKI